jgi:hypothetical protein
MSQIPRFHRTELIIPRSARGYATNEFLYFRWHPSVNPCDYRILVEDLSGRWVTLGQLDKQVFIPNTYFPADATLAIVGHNPKGTQTRFTGNLTRGATYELGPAMPGDHLMYKSKAWYPFVGQ